MYQIPETQTIYFYKDKFDTHAAYNKVDKVYTIVRDGSYTFNINGIEYTKYHIHGDFIIDPLWVCDTASFNLFNSMIQNYKFHELRSITIKKPEYYPHDTWIVFIPCFLIGIGFLLILVI